MTDYEHLIQGDDDTDYDVEPKAEHVEQASESLRRAQYYRLQLAQMKAPFAAEQARLTEREAEVCGPIEKKIAWHVGALEAFHRAALAAKAVKPMLKLPHGHSLLKAKAPLVTIVDEAELLVWAKGEGIDLLPDPPKPKVAKAKLNKILDIKGDPKLEPGADVPFAGPGGVAVPGVTVVVQEPGFSTGDAS